jgi:hypothetical protein
MDYIARWPAFGITPDIREKLMRISPATIDRALKKDKAALKGKSLTNPGTLLKHRIPIRTFYTSDERKLPGFFQIDTVHHCGQATSGQYLLTLTATDVASGWICLYSLLNKAHRWTFDALTDIHAGLPFPLREFYSDNSNEFINQVITDRHRNPACPIPLHPLKRPQEKRQLLADLRSESNRKTAPWSGSISAMTVLRGKPSGIASQKSTALWFPFTTSSCPR